MQPLFTLKGLRKRFEDRVALDIRSLDMYEGFAYSLVGPNGSGKSTLLNILAFLSTPTSGELFFSGEKVFWNRNRIVPLRKEVALLHQSPFLFDGTVYSNIAFGLTMRGIKGENQRIRVAESLEMVGLAGFEGRKAGKLSGGEVQRVAMARVLALKPRVLLLDEPLANVDGETADLINQVIISLPGGGTTVVVSTHDRSQVSRLPGREIHLSGGRLVEKEGAQIQIIRGGTGDARI